MFKRTLLSLAAAAPLLLMGAPAIHAASNGVNCSFTMGFAALDSLIPDQVGGCLTNPYQISNGNVVQETTVGLMSWNPHDNLPEFTNGSQTWVLGPFGLQARANDTTFPYEAPSSNVAGVVLSNQPTGTVVGCLNALISADGIDHPVSESETIPASGTRSC